MKVEEIITSNNKVRYMLVNNLGDSVEPVLKFIRYKDNAGKARNTLRSYCFGLKLFFEFLEQKDMDFRKVGIDEMAEFMRWLQNPYQISNVTSIKPIESTRTSRTLNIYLSRVMEFYDYLMRHEDYSLQLSEKLKKQIPGSRRGFKDFLFHINKDKLFYKNILKIKTPKCTPRTISKENISKLINSCCNLRDKFLLQLLWESGFRISECLALWLEDFIVDAKKIDLKDRGELINLAEIKTVYSPRTVDISSDLMNLYMDYIAEYHTDEVDTNHVFIKLSGSNKYQPMGYPEITSLFERLYKKTGIDVTSHMFRHSHFDALRKQGWSPEKIQKRGGWANVQTPMQIYMHPDEEEIRKAWEQVEVNMKLKRPNKGDVQL